MNRAEMFSFWKELLHQWLLVSYGKNEWDLPWTNWKNTSLFPGRILNFLYSQNFFEFASPKKNWILLVNAELKRFSLLTFPKKFYTLSLVIGRSLERSTDSLNGLARRSDTVVRVSKNVAYNVKCGNFKKFQPSFFYRIKRIDKKEGRFLLE